MNWTRLECVVGGIKYCHWSNATRANLLLVSSPYNTAHHTGYYYYFIAGFRHVLKGEVILEQWLLATRSGPLPAEALEKLKTVQNEVNKLRPEKFINRVI